MVLKNLSLLGFLLLLFSCTREKEIKVAEPPEKVITNIIQNIDGDIGQYAYAKNDRITIAIKKENTDYFNGFKIEIPIKIIFATPFNISSGRGYNDYGANFELEFLDATDRVIDDIKATMNTPMTDLSNFIKSGNREEWITFSTTHYVSTSDDYSLDNSKKFIDKLSNISKVRIKSSIIAEEKETSNEEVNNNNNNNNSAFGSSKKSGTSSDCNKFLDDYEELVLAYVRAAKKYADNPSTLSYMTEMTNRASKASRIEGDLEQCKSDAYVAARMIELNLKMAQAMQ